MKLDRSPELGVFEAPSAVVGPEAPRVASAQMQEMLDNMAGADPSIRLVEDVAEQPKSPIEDSLDAMSPEARKDAEAALTKVGGGVVEASGVVVSVSETSAGLTEADIIAGVNEAESYANDPAHATEAGGSGGGESATTKTTSGDSDPHGEPFRSTTEETPRMLTPDEIRSINESLASFSPGTESVDTRASSVESTADAKEAAVETVSERPISTNRFTVEAVSAPESTAPKSRAGKLVEGVAKKVNGAADRLEGVRDIRADTRHIIAKQKEVLDARVGTAEDRRSKAGSNRRSALWHNNRVARAFGGENRAKYDALRQDKLNEAYRAIGEARHRKNESRHRPVGQESWSDKLRKGAAFITTRAEAKAELRQSAREAMASTKEKLSTARTEVRSLKRLRRPTTFRPWRSRRSVAGAAGGAVSSYNRAKDFQSLGEADKIAQAKARAAELMKKRKADDARTKWKSRAESEIKSDRSILYGPATPGRAADRISGRF